MNKKKLLLIIAISVLVILLTPYFGKLYELIIGRKITTWFVGPVNPSYYEGFLLSYSFIVTLLLTLFITERKYKKLLYFLGIIIIFDIFLFAWENLIINIAAIITAWILAQIILLIFKSVKK